MDSLLILGSQPELSAAEAAAQYPRARFTPIGQTLLVEGADTSLDRLAGTVKIGTVFCSLPLAELTPDRIADWIALHPRGEGKLVYAVSFFGERWDEARRFPLECKRIFRERFSRPVRWFADREGETSSAAVRQLGLLDEGYEFLVAVKGGRAFVAVTSDVQDPDLWTKRDFGRPRRNAKNGMLPPKLAEILFHLAGPDIQAVFDPFCGSGTILEAAARNGTRTIYGSDILPGIIADAKENFGWAQAQGLVAETSEAQFRVADATEPPDLPPNSIEAIVSEGYLGRPLQGYEPLQVLQEEQRTVERLWRESLQHWRAILVDSGTVIAVWPEYQTSLGEARVDLSEKALRDLGFRREPFVVAGQDGPKDALLYARAEQSIRRRIVKLRKI